MAQDRPQHCGLPGARDPAQRTRGSAYTDVRDELSGQSLCQAGNRGLSIVQQSPGGESKRDFRGHGHSTPESASADGEVGTDSGASNLTEWHTAGAQAMLGAGSDDYGPAGCVHRGWTRAFQLITYVCLQTPNYTLGLQHTNIHTCRHTSIAHTPASVCKSCEHTLPVGTGPHTNTWSLFTYACDEHGPERHSWPRMRPATMFSTREEAPESPREATLVLTG